MAVFGKKRTPEGIIQGDGSTCIPWGNSDPLEENECENQNNKTDIWGCYFNNLRGIMKETGGNQYKPAHNDSRNRRKETGSPIDLSVNLEDYISCLDFLSD